MAKNPVPLNIKLHKQSKTLELTYAAEHCILSCEYLRVFSPSAEVRGHGTGQEVLQSGKIDVAIDKISAVGNYALQLVFSDGHDSGIYSWDYLYQLCINKDIWWQNYLERLESAGALRDPEVQVVKIGN